MVNQTLIYQSEKQDKSISLEDIDLLNEKAWNERRSDLKSTWKTANDTERFSIIYNYQKGIAESSRTLGYCLWRFGDYSKSLEKSMAALELFRLLKDKKGEADTLNSVGAVYMYQGDNANRLKCNELCLKIRQEIKDLEGVAGSENNIGETYFEMGNFSEAMNWFNKCLINPHSTPQVLAWAHHNIGKIHQKNNEHEFALNSLNQSLHISQSVNYEVLTIATHINIAESITQLNFNSTEIDAHLNTALALATEIGINEEIHRIYFALSQIEEQRNNISKSFEWFKKYHTAYENLFNENSNQKINNIQTQYEIERARQETEFERTKRLELKEFVEKISQQKNEISEKNREITDSIKYASRIQYAALTTNEYIKHNFPFEYFILYKPKDIVSGDFYWLTRKDEHIYLAICDSTGHGVPGAFMSLLNISFLNEAINEKNITEPNLIFNYVRQRLIENLAQEEQQDGMDGTLLKINSSTGQITYSAAYNEPIMVRDNKIIPLPADKMPIGKGLKQESFTNYQLNIQKGDRIYLLTDGFADQFGGLNELERKKGGKKFKYKKIRQLLTEISYNHLDTQLHTLNNSFENWRGDLEQVDDVTCFGFKIY